MRLPKSTLHFKPGLPNNPLGKVYAGSICIKEKGSGFVKMHQLGWYQIVLVLAGEGQYQDVQGRQFRLGRGDLVITTPDVPHHCAPTRDAVWSKLTISFNGAIFDLLRESCLLKSPEHAIALVPMGAWYRRLYTLFHLSPHEQAQPLRYLFRFLSVLSEIQVAQRPGTAEGRPSWLTAALSMIEASNQTEALPVQQIAKACNMGYESFRKKFSRLTGASPIDYHRNLRIKTASELIAYGGESFKQIARQLGYFDEFHFSNHFKEKTGLSPTQFKTKLSEKKIKLIDSERVHKLALQEWFKAEEDKRVLEEKTAAERRRNWRLVYEEGFNAQNIPSSWDIPGKWRIENGELRIWGENAWHLRFKNPVPGDVRLVFECRVESEFVSDVSCFLSAMKTDAQRENQDGFIYQHGYFFQYGGWENRKIILKGPAGVLWNQRASPLVRGQRFHVEAQKIGSRLMLTVDDQTIFDVQDANPVSGAEHAFLGLYSWGTAIFYSKIQVYTRDSAAQADLLEMAEDFYTRGKYATAQDLFQEVLSSSHDGRRTEQAQQGLARAAALIGLTSEFPSIKARLIKIWPTAGIEMGDGGIIVRVNQAGIEDLTPLKGLTLHELSCNNNRIASLAPLKGLRLRKLSCSGNRIKSLDPVNGMNLVSLDCSDNQIKSLEPLRGMKLSQLISTDNQIHTLEPLRGMNLFKLAVDNNRIKSLDPLSSMSLNTLGCSRNQISSLEPLRDMHLHRLQCNGNQIETLDPLRNMRLDSLFCSDNPLKSIEAVLDHLPKRLQVDLEDLKAAEQHLIKARSRVPA